jgi:hypothetical protein
VETVNVFFENVGTFIAWERQQQRKLTYMKIIETDYREFFT